MLERKKSKYDKSVYKGVEKWKKAELHKNNKNGKKEKRSKMLQRISPQFPLRLLNCIISVPLDDILTRVLKD